MRLAERAGARRDDLAELDVGGAEVGERLRDLLDDLLLEGAAADEVADDPRAGAGDLPTRHADAGGLDWQRHPVQPGYLAVLGGCHTCSVSKVPSRAEISCGTRHSRLEACCASESSGSASGCNTTESAPVRRREAAGVARLIPRTSPISVQVTPAPCSGLGRDLHGVRGDLELRGRLFRRHRDCFSGCRLARSSAVLCLGETTHLIAVNGHRRIDCASSADCA